VRFASTFATDEGEDDGVRVLQSATTISSH